MKTKSLFRIFLVLLVLSFVGCDKNDEYTDVTLEETSVRVPYLQAYSIRIEGGSGEYLPSIDRSEIADVEIVQTYGAGTILRIQTKEGGEALITVTDKKSGKTAKCSLFVSKDGIPLTDIRYGVEADQREAILADLTKQEPYPIGSRFVPVPLTLTAGATGEWIVLGVDGKGIDNGRYTVTEVEGTVPVACKRLIPIETQIYTWYTIHVELKDIEHVYYMFLIRSSRGTGNYADVYFYENLTDHYKVKYPSVGVNAVVRAYIRNW